MIKNVELYAKRLVNVKYSEVSDEFTSDPSINYYPVIVKMAKERAMSQVDNWLEDKNNSKGYIDYLTQVKELIKLEM